MQQAQLAPRGAKMTLTATALRAFYFGEQAKQDAASTAKTEASRLAFLFALFSGAEVKAAADAFSGMVSGVKNDSGSDSAEYRSASKRASEARSLYGAHKFCGYTPEGVGYHDAYATAVEKLKAAALKWNGTALLTADEAKTAKDASKARKLAVKAVEIATENGGKADATTLPAAIGKAKQEIALEIAFSIIERHGAELAELVASGMKDALPNYGAWKAAKDAK